MRLSLLLICTFSFLSLGLRAHAAPQPQKDWTFLLFLNGHNNLDDAGYMNLNQMEQVGSSNQVNLVVQWASIKNNTTERLYIKKDNDTTNITSPVIQNMGAVDMGDVNVLKDFILWGMHNYPAKHYFVAVWDHGSGWHQFAGSAFHPNDISWDDTTGHFITTQQLGWAIRDVVKETGNKIDIYGSDACMMQMLEVAAEMKGAINYFVGSEETEPADGWPYNLFLAPLIANPEMTPAQLASQLTDSYNQYYTSSSSQSDVTFSAVDMSQFDNMEAAVRQLGKDIQSLPAPAHAAVMSAVTNTQSFTYSDYGDLGDFLRILYTQKDLSVYANHIQAAADVLQSFVIRNRPTTGYKLAQGISFWLPKDQGSYDGNSALYKTMAFDQDTHWSSAIEAYLK